MADKIDPDHPISEGEVIVRVGADGLVCPNGRNFPIYPVVQLIWPAGEARPFPKGDIAIRWQDKLDSTKPSKSSSPKYIGLVARGGEQWVGYRVSDKDREQFETLRKKWGIWFLRVRRQGGEDRSWSYFNEGGFFAGAIIDDLPRYVQISDAAKFRELLTVAWQDTLKNIRVQGMDSHTNFDSHKHFAKMQNIPKILEDLGGGPLPWLPKEMEYWGKPDRKSHDDVIALYLKVIQALKQNSENENVSEKFRHESGQMWNLMRRAKIFEIAPESYVELHLQVDRHITEDIAQLKFHHPHEPKIEIPESESLLLYRRQTEACQKLPFPDKMPFDVCWFALAGLTGLSDHQAATRGLPDPEVNVYMLMGILVGDAGEHHEILLTRGDRGEDFVDANLHVVTHHVEEESAWQHETCMAPFVLHAIVDSINEHQTTIVSQAKLSFHNQGKIKKGLEDLGLKKPIPPPFYTVHLRDKVIKETFKSYTGGALRAKYAHRFDVRGHWCFKIFRGPMPMDSELELHLDKLKYDIFKTKEIDEATVEALRERGQPPRDSNEWLAVKKFWRNSFVKGPDDGPYIPSTRKATKGVLAFDNEELSVETSITITAP